MRYSPQLSIETDICLIKERYIPIKPIALFKREISLPIFVFLFFFFGSAFLLRAAFMACSIPHLNLDFSVGILGFAFFYFLV